MFLRTNWDVLFDIHLIPLLSKQKKLDIVNFSSVMYSGHLLYFMSVSKIKRYSPPFSQPVLPLIDFKLSTPGNN